MSQDIGKIKDERMASIVKELAAEFVARHSNRQSLLTVTRVTLSSDLKNANVLLSVFPRSAEDTALDFLNRHRDDFRDFLKEKTKLHILPFTKFVADEGEYNRQRINELLEEGEK